MTTPESAQQPYGSATPTGARGTGRSGLATTALLLAVGATLATMIVFITGIATMSTSLEQAQAFALASAIVNVIAAIAAIVAIILGIIAVRGARPAVSGAAIGVGAAQLASGLTTVIVSILATL